MFTGIVETLGELVDLDREVGNCHFLIESPISSDLKIDQSVSHDGVCLTVVSTNGNRHQVTAVAETLNRSNLGRWKIGHRVNLERSLRLGDRLDGHLVQGHVDCLGICEEIQSMNGSHLITIGFPSSYRNLLVDKGSISVNGISLTVIVPDDSTFKVAIIPYTWEVTNLRELQAGDPINLEFDIIGKYLLRHSGNDMSTKTE